MTGSCRITLLTAALAFAAPAFATSISGGFDIAGSVNDQTLSSHTGFLSFTPSAETPSNGTGVFAGITPSDTFDSFTSLLFLYLIENGTEPTVFVLTFNGNTYTFKATSYEPGSTVKIAGVLSDTNSDTGYGEIDFVSPPNGSGTFSGNYAATPSLDVLNNGATPEPASLTLLATGLGATMMKLRRRKS